MKLEAGSVAVPTSPVGGHVPGVPRSPPVAGLPASLPPGPPSPPFPRESVESVDGQPQQLKLWTQPRASPGEWNRPGRHVVEIWDIYDHILLDEFVSEGDTQRLQSGTSLVIGTDSVRSNHENQVGNDRRHTSGDPDRSILIISRAMASTTGLRPGGG